MKYTDLTHLISGLLWICSCTFRECFCKINF